MKVGIVGLGLIGGSFAKAYSAAGHTVAAIDIDKSVLDFAILSGAVNEVLSDEAIPECDLILLCVYPGAAVNFLKSKADVFGKKPIVIDCCGTKRLIVREGTALSKAHGFTYIGGHPMAGTQYSGFKHSRKDMYKGAPMVIIPPTYDDIGLLSRVKELLSPAGFASITVTDAETHDEVIAYTSQLAHIISSAYIKSPAAAVHRGMSAGSFRDMTRVSWMNPEMWSELFLDNSDHLLTEIDTIIKNLVEYKDAIASGNKAELIRLIEDGRHLKEEAERKLSKEEAAV